jgi:exodeoxyribonuclease VII large subunit
VILSEKKAATVSQVNRRISDVVAGDELLSGIAVKGEVSNFKLHRQSGHIYFTLKDDKSTLKCVMFKSFADKIKFLPGDGTEVIAEGDVRVFEREGVCQLYTQSISLDGTGSLYEKFEQLKIMLNEEGVFSKKRLLPRIPRKIAVITAPDAAAFRDMVSVIGRRFPAAEILLIPTLVQGANAPESIVNALSAAQNTSADIIILGRGGGSAEDLQSFNNENVARAIFASRIPTISAVGHEIDFTIADFAADLRAPTPSAAAEIAVPDINSLKMYAEEISHPCVKKSREK